MDTQFFDLIKLFLSLHPTIAPLLFVLIQVFLATFLIPCSLMTLVAGFLWGAIFGFCISTISTVFAASFTFYLSRSCFRSLLKNFLYKRFHKFKKYMLFKKVLSWKGLVLIQINPIMPISSSGYFFGLTSTSFKKFILLTIIVIIPLQIIYTSAGSFIFNILINEIFDANVFFKLLFFIILCLFSVKLFRFVILKNFGERFEK